MLGVGQVVPDPARARHRCEQPDLVERVDDERARLVGEGVTALPMIAGNLERLPGVAEPVVTTSEEGDHLGRDLRGAAHGPSARS